MAPEQAEEGYVRTLIDRLLLALLASRIWYWLGHSELKVNPAIV